MECVICARGGDSRLHEGSVGGNLYEDELWYAYHAPTPSSVAGQLFLVSRRHFLDFADMTPEEASSYGSVLRRLVAAVKRATRAERVYVLVTLEGVSHFHAWLVPRGAGLLTRGWTYVTGERSCSDDAALAVASQIRRELEPIARGQHGAAC